MPELAAFLHLPNVIGSRTLHFAFEAWVVCHNVFFLVHLQAVDSPTSSATLVAKVKRLFDLTKDCEESRIIGSCIE